MWSIGLISLVFLIASPCLAASLEAEETEETKKKFVFFEQFDLDKKRGLSYTIKESEQSRLAVGGPVLDTNGGKLTPGLSISFRF